MWLFAGCEVDQRKERMWGVVPSLTLLAFGAKSFYVREPSRALPVTEQHLSPSSLDTSSYVSP